MYRSLLFPAVLSVGAQSVLAQGIKPNAAPLDTMQRARSYSIVNRSNETIVAAHARMTNGHERDLAWNEPLRPQHGRNVALPSKDCVAKLTAKFQSGRIMQTSAPDCRETQITVTNDALQIGSSASDRPPTE
jgi:hypothetical protein